MQQYDNKLLIGDSLTHLKSLPDGIVQCCVTSPPYYGLRDYGTGNWEGGSDPGCEHSKLKTPTRCASCGARRIDPQIGMEESPEEYVGRLVNLFAEVRRVLRDDGTLWLNLGDSYCSTGPGTWGDPLHRRGILAGVKQETANARRKFRPATPEGMKPKDLMGIPWMVAFALRSNGWWLRADNIWSKGVCMPESVKDRPTRSHEYVFLLAKSERYFYDPEGAKEASVEGGHRNRRSVWNINPKPYKGAHFAVMPEELAQVCVLAGSKPGDLVLDPFAGSGTTLAVARSMGRPYLGIELNPAYEPLIEERLQKAWEADTARQLLDLAME